MGRYNGTCADSTREDRVKSERRHCRYTSELRVACVGQADVKEQFEARYAAQEGLLKAEIKSLTEQGESRASEIKRLQSHVESYKLSNEELNVSCLSRQRFTISADL